MKNSNPTHFVSCINPTTDVLLFAMLVSINLCKYMQAGIQFYPKLTKPEYASKHVSRKALAK